MKLLHLGLALGGERLSHLGGELDFLRIFSRQTSSCASASSLFILWCCLNSSSDMPREEAVSVTCNTKRYFQKLLKSIYLVDLPGHLGLLLHLHA